MTLLRTNPAVMIPLLALLLVTLVFTVLAVLMTRAGASLRPLVFMGVFFGIVGGPQLLFHLAQGLGWIPKRDLTSVPSGRAGQEYREVEGPLAVAGNVFADPLAVFGPATDPDLVSDLTRLGSDGPYGDAQVAQMAIVPPSATALVARYESPDRARQAMDRYLQVATGQALAPGHDGVVVASRPVGDVVLALTAGRTMLVLTGPDEQAVRTALAASPIVTPAPAQSPSDAGAATFWLYRPAVLAMVTLVLVGLATLWFFKGSNWASSVPAVAGVTPVSAQELRSRLLAINALDVPYSVHEESPGGRVVVTWRFADARWVDLARVHGMRATHRILIDLDESRRTARPTEQVSRVDWSAGANGGGVSWRTSSGIVFFQYEHQRVFGLQLDEQGRFTPRLSYSYTFNLQEMKAPLISAVTRGGWTWRPTAWHGPSWLRWLTG
ncbi:MAG: hypothetical protein ACYC2K_12770 [Gemmatimonadales bacterium]